MSLAPGKMYDPIQKNKKSNKGKRGRGHVSSG
jgi:hypothetical protein